MVATAQNMKKIAMTLSSIPQIGGVCKGCPCKTKIREINTLIRADKRQKAPKTK